MGLMLSLLRGIESDDIKLESGLGGSLATTLTLHVPTTGLGIPEGPILKAVLCHIELRLVYRGTKIRSNFFRVGA